MKKKQFVAISAVAALTLLTSCGKKVYPLYNYGAVYKSEAGSQYEMGLHANAKYATPEAFRDLLLLHKALIENPGIIRQVPPPGVCADYGFMLLQPGAAAALGTSLGLSADDAQKLGEAMLKKEIELYPESKTFIEPIIEKITK